MFTCILDLCGAQWSFFPVWHLLAFIERFPEALPDKLAQSPLFSGLEPDVYPTVLVL